MCVSVDLKLLIQHVSSSKRWFIRLQCSLAGFEYSIFIFFQYISLRNSVFDQQCFQSTMLCCTKTSKQKKFHNTSWRQEENSRLVTQVDIVQNASFGCLSHWTACWSRAADFNQDFVHLHRPTCSLVIIYLKKKKKSFRLSLENDFIFKIMQYQPWRLSPVSRSRQTLNAITVNFSWCFGSVCLTQIFGFSAYVLRSSHRTSVIWFCACKGKILHPFSKHYLFLFFC